MSRHIDISLPAATIDALKSVGSALYVLKAVKYGFKGVPFTPPSNAMLKKAISPSTGGGAPVLVKVVTNYLARTTVEWSQPVAAYVSQSPITDQQLIRAPNPQPVELGQTVNVDPNGGLSVVAGGGEGAVAIANQGQTPWTCGLSQDFGAGPAPTCAFPLFGSGMDVLRPVDQALLMFATNLLPVGTIVSTAYSAALLVDAAADDRAVSFDVNQGWSAGGASWGRPVAAGTDIGPLLITT
ncbi:MAG: hypothetical protein ABW360_16315 [Phenylobacterium sp.]